VAELFCVCTPLDEGRVLVCAIARDRVETVLASGESLELYPIALPELAVLESMSAERREQIRTSLNLLVGPFEPDVLVKGRARRAWIVAGMLIALGLLAVVGAARTVRFNDDRAKQARAETVEASGGRVPSEINTEIDRLKQLQHEQQARECDAALMLQTWLASDATRIAGLEANSISVTPTSLTVSRRVVTEGDVAIPIPEGWSQKDSRMRRTSAGREVVVTLHREGGP
jgi:Tfp pilus assembly protein PilV